MYTYIIHTYVHACKGIHNWPWCTCPHIAMHNNCTCVCALIMKSVTFVMISHDHYNSA